MPAKLLILSCLLAGFALAQSPVAQKQKDHSGGRQSDAGRAANVPHESGPVYQMTTVPKEEAPKDWSNWALVIVGTAAGVAAFWTLAVVRKQVRTMERQTAVMERQTTAIEGQVKAMVLSERPWIIVSSPDVSKLSEFAVTSSFGVFYIPLTYVNYGKTLGIITLTKAKAVVVAGGGPLLPEEPDYSGTGFTTIDATIPLPPDRPYQPVRPGVNSVEFAPVWAGKDRLYVYGVVYYRDTFDTKSSTYETRFCFVFERQLGMSPLPNDLYVWSNRKYNLQT